MSSEYDIVMDITGMKCERCVASVKNAIEGIAGIESVDVQLSENRAYVKGSEINKETIAEVVRKAGFDVKE
jgi:copper chaperone CopZ